MTWVRRPEPWVFLILLGSYAFFWHSRDWNGASRLMLTYALVDRGTVSLDGLDEQTRDMAFFQGRFYSDKLPGYSLLAAGPYALARAALRLPPHPLNRKALDYWPADYWVTLATSGVLSAATGVLLIGLARDLGCGPRRAALVGLAYGLATPAYAYATMSYGHQASACSLLASFTLLWRAGRGRSSRRAFWAGLLAAFAAVIELQVGPVSAILGCYLLAQVVAGRRPAADIGEFAVGAALPTLLLLGYNQLAFGSPWELGYFHHATAVFARVHNARNPLGLRPPDGSLLAPLLWGEYRGLLFYAPVLALSVPGWAVLVARRCWGMALVSAAAVAAIFVVNLSYPEWTGGWSTGPRLLVPLLPFAMLPVAALLAVGGRLATVLALVLALAGGVVILLFQGAGARIPDKVLDLALGAERPVSHPLWYAVWPLWRGDAVLAWPQQERFERNLVNVLWPRAIEGLPKHWRWVQFLPLVAVQAVTIVALVVCCRAGSPGSEEGARARPAC